MSDEKKKEPDLSKPGYWDAQKGVFVPMEGVSSTLVRDTTQSPTGVSPWANFINEAIPDMAVVRAYIKLAEKSQTTPLDDNFQFKPRLGALNMQPVLLEALREEDNALREQERGGNYKGPVSKIFRGDEINKIFQAVKENPGMHKHYLLDSRFAGADVLDAALAAKAEHEKALQMGPSGHVKVVTATTCMISSLTSHLEKLQKKVEGLEPAVTKKPSRWARITGAVKEAIGLKGKEDSRAAETQVGRLEPEKRPSPVPPPPPSPRQGRDKGKGGQGGEGR